MVNSSSFNLDCLSKNKELLKMAIAGIILLVIIIIIYNMCIKPNYNTKENKDTIIFYVAKGCSYCKKLQSFINKYKKQNKINIIIVKEEEMTKKEKKQITVFPTAIRYSDNKKAEGEADIKKLVKQTLAKSNIEYFETHTDADANSDSDSDSDNDNDVDVDANTKNSINPKDTIQFYLSERCSYSQNILPFIEEYKKTQNVVNVELIYEKDIPKELNIEGYPAAIRKSDNERVYGGHSILNLMKETLERNNNQNVKQEEKQEEQEDNTILVFLADWCPHCQELKPQLNEIIQTNSNVKLVDSKNISPDLQKYVEGYPCALKLSDKTPAVGASEILKMINSVNNKPDNKSDNKTNYNFVYSKNCKYSEMIMPKWYDFKIYVTDKKLNVNLLEYESNEIDNLSNKYKSQLVGFPTLFVNDNEKYEGYDDILNYLNNLSL